VKADLQREMKQEHDYYNYLKTERESSYAEVQQDDALNHDLLQVLDELEKTYNPKAVNTSVQPPGINKDSLPKLDTPMKNKFFTPRKDTQPRKK
jgi:hypothetical protein